MFALCLSYPKNPILRNEDTPKIPMTTKNVRSGLFLVTLPEPENEYERLRGTPSNE